MGYFGGYSFYRVDTPVQLAHWQLRMFTRPGCIGAGFHVIGYHGRPYGVTCHNYFLLPGYESTALVNYAALCSSLVTIIDDKGETWLYRRVLGMRVVEQSVKFMAGYDHYFLTVQFLVVPTI